MSVKLGSNRVTSERLEKKMTMTMNLGCTGRAVNAKDTINEVTFSI